MRGQSGDKSKIRLQAQVCSGRARTLGRQTHWSLRSAQQARLREGGGHGEDSGRRGGRPEPRSLNSAEGTERGTRDCRMSLRAKSAGALTTVSGQLNRPGSESLQPSVQNRLLSSLVFPKVSLEALLPASSFPPTLLRSTLAIGDMSLAVTPFCPHFPLAGQCS